MPAPLDSRFTIHDLRLFYFERAFANSSPGLYCGICGASATLRQVVEAVARERGLKVKGDTRPEQGLFFRSDHFPLAKAGIPAVSLKSGVEFVGQPADYGAKQFAAYNAAHYHQPSDEYRESWDLAGMIEEIEIALAIGRRVADAPEMPRYNPGDEFAKSR